MPTARPEATVFIVDDDPAVREGLRALLEAKGFAVECFQSAEAFLAAVDGERRGCVIADVRMPGMSGLDLQREMKRRALNLPIVRQAQRRVATYCLSSRRVSFRLWSLYRSGAGHLAHGALDQAPTAPGAACYVEAAAV